MPRPKRNAAIQCLEKMNKLNSRKPAINTNKFENKIQIKSCSVRLTKSDCIPMTELSKYTIKPCHVQITKVNYKPPSKIVEPKKTCFSNNRDIVSQTKVAIKPKSQKKIQSKFRSAPNATPTPTTDIQDNKKLESVYDFTSCSQSSQSSEDECMKNVIKKLKNKCNVKIIKKRPGKSVRPKQNLNKSWVDKNVQKARKLIKPKINKLQKARIQEMISNELVIPIVKPKSANKMITRPVLTTVVPGKLDESILPLINDVQDDNDHFGDYENNNENHNDENNSTLYNSNIENINPNQSNNQREQLNPPNNKLVRSPLKALNTSYLNESNKSSPRKDTPMLRTKLLKRLSLTKATSFSTPFVERAGFRLQMNVKPRILPIEDANTTNYFGFISDLAMDGPSKLGDHSSTPVRIATKDTLMSKLATLKLQTPKVNQPSTPPPTVQSQRAKHKSPVKLLPNNNETVNFADALSSTLLPEPETAKTRKPPIRRTYSRVNITEARNCTNNLSASNLYDNLIGEPLEETRDIPLTVNTKRKSPTKRPPLKVYEKPKGVTNKPDKAPTENKDLTSFYETFNTLCREVDQFSVIIE